MKHKFIAIEGIDGAGKTTITSLLKDKYGESCALFREPTAQSPQSFLIRAILSGKKDYNEDEIRKLFMEDRLWNIENNLKPSLQKNNLTILDRYYFSTAAYQGQNPDDVNSIIEYYLNATDILQPDAVFYLKIDLNTALRRILSRNQEKDIFEKKNRLQKILENYDFIFSQDWLPFPVFILDAGASPEEQTVFIMQKVSLIG